MGKSLLEKGGREVVFDTVGVSAVVVVAAVVVAASCLALSNLFLLVPASPSLVHAISVFRFPISVPHDTLRIQRRRRRRRRLLQFFEVVI